MSNLENALGTALRERAEGEVDVSALLHGAQARGVRLGRRRKVAGGLAAGVTALAVSAGIALVIAHPLGGTARQAPTGLSVAGPGGGTAPGLPGATRAGTAAAGGVTPGPPSASPIPTAGSQDSFPTLPRPPIFGAAVPASQDATVVGGATFQLHLDLASIPGSVDLAQWNAFDGWERLVVQAKAGQLEADISRDRGQLPEIYGATHTGRLNGRSATIAVSGPAAHSAVQVRWQPVSGVWAEVSAPGPESAALAIAAGLKLTKVYRCAVPFRLSTIPAGLTEQGCGLTFEPAGVAAMASVGTSTWTATVTLQGGTSVKANTTLAGRPARVIEQPGDGGKTIMQVDLNMGDHLTDFTVEGAYAKAEILRLVGSYHEVAPFSDPASWTGGPFGN